MVLPGALVFFHFPLHMIESIGPAPGFTMYTMLMNLEHVYRSFLTALEETSSDGGLELAIVLGELRRFSVRIGKLLLDIGELGLRDHKLR